MKFDNKDRLLIHNKKAHSGRGERKKNSWDTALYTTESYRIGIQQNRINGDQS
jgi:hypothetical protein